jgi:N-acyl-D-glucosamine 2-epimerase
MVYNHEVSMNIFKIKSTTTRSPLIFIMVLFSFIVMEKAFTKNLTDNIQATRDTIAIEMQQVLGDEFKSWYPLSLDTLYGGFYSDLNDKWELYGPQNKFIVTQARHVWSTANACMFYQKDNTLRNVAGHGVRFLKDIMWDREFGGFYDLVTRQGEPIKEDGSIIKRAYGNAFAIYGLAAYYRASGDTAALKLAQETFWWLEKHSYDPQYGGYFQFMTRDGIPFPEGYRYLSPRDEIHFQDGYRIVPPKDQNSSIHLLECFTELYKIWPDSTLKERLSSMLRLVRDVITTDKGYLTLFLNRDLTPVTYRDSIAAVRKKNYEFDHVSFGHDVETAYLMLEASEALGLKNDTTTLRVAKKMVDHALRNGWDKEHGGFYDGGYYFPGEKNAVIVRNTKEWWTQIEALNSFLMMSDLFPHDEQRYYEKFCIQWNYCKKYLIDQEHGGWYVGGIDIVPNMKYAPKGSIWKGNYHTSRGLINCINRLKSQTFMPNQKHFDPVNKNAIPQARKLLDYLYSISGKKIIAGHHNYVGRTDTYPNRVKELTGKLPEIWGCDFAGYFHKGYTDTLIQTAYKKYNDGYIITLMWHVGRPQDDPPFSWKESVQAKMTDKEWAELITPGTKLNSRWVSRVDTIAGYLKELQMLGVPVLWRPYHELNGVWFWWGNRKGENGSAKLYRMMFDRFVNYHKLNNLIWVWNTNAPRQLMNDEAYAYEDYFPGLEYVDVLAADVYHSDYRQSHHDELVKLGQGKVIALGEVGEVPTPEILARQSLWTWFMVWGNFVDTHNTPQQIRDLYNYPKILTHEDFLKEK